MSRLFQQFFYEKIHHRLGDIKTAYELQEGSLSRLKALQRSNQNLILF